MNLLIDQREDSGEKRQEWTPPVMDAPPSPVSEEPATVKPPATEAPLDYYQFDDSEGRKRSILGPLIVILGLLGAIVAAAYYGFFYKSEELRGYSPAIVQTETQPEPTKPIAETITTEPAPAATTPVETETPPQSQSAATPALPDYGSGQGPLQTAVQLIATVIAARPQEVQLTTLIMDESSFSAEVSSASRADIENYFAALQTKVPGPLSFSPSSGYYTGVRALINGTFSDINKTIPAPTGEVDLKNLKKELRQLAVDNRFKSPEITFGKAVVRGTRHSTPIFIKVIGSEGDFEAYGRAIAQRYPYLTLHKIILMLKPTEKVTGVFRLEFVSAS